jgi:hypothetical protein
MHRNAGIIDDNSNYRGKKNSNTKPIVESLQNDNDGGGDTVTDCTDGAPQCGGDVDALTLAIPLPHTVVGGHFRLTPWFGLDPFFCVRRVSALV